MVTTQKPLLNLSAAEIMSQNVVMIPREMSVAGAARLLSRAQVSGAPVVDANGVCVGVLSSTDFLHWAEDTPQKPHPKKHASHCSAWQILENEADARQCVADIMTHDPVLVEKTTLIGDLARRMLDAHIHRVIVVEQGHPIGVVSATDILAALAHADRLAHEDFLVP